LAVRPNSRNRGKHAVDQTAESAGRIRSWSDVLRVVQSDAARSEFLNRFRSSGFTPDQFEHKPAARRAVSDALTWTEDLLEFKRGPKAEAERAEIRYVRRRLEVELWP